MGPRIRRKESRELEGHTVEVLVKILFIDLDLLRLWMQGRFVEFEGCDIEDDFVGLFFYLKATRTMMSVLFLYKLVVSGLLDGGMPFKCERFEVRFND